VKISELASWDSAESIVEPSEFQKINRKSFAPQKRPKLVATCFCSRRPGKKSQLF